jgi:predicted ATPase/DNA-binding XRE family transcriptional regulator
MSDGNGVAPFGELLRQNRRDAGLTQEALAQSSGMSVQAIAAIENGRRLRPHRQTVAALVGALRLTAEQREAIMAAAGRGAASAAPALPRRLDLRVPSVQLIGRRRELATVLSLLGRARVRLLTLTGPPGVGKTQLAVQAASELKGTRVVPIDLAPLVEPAQLGAAIRQAVEISDADLRPLGVALAAIGADEPLVLLLDNFEHLLDGAAQLAELLAAAPRPRLRLLVTSRTPLRLRDEHELHVSPLSAAEAVRLFERRARACSPGFQVAGQRGTLGEICERLDRLPLAIELAAAWARVLGPRELLARLESGLDILVDGAPDLPERQRTMRRTLEWSHRLLEPPAQALFRRLSVFAGGAALDAAEAIWRAGGGDDDFLGSLATLVDHDFLLRDTRDGAVRLRMLTTLREYGHEALADSGEAEDVLRAHATWCLRFARTADRGLVGPGQAEWTGRLDLERENMRVALRWTLRRAPELGLELAAWLRRYWCMRGLMREGMEWLSRFLERARAAPVRSRAQALNAAGDLAYRTGSYDDADAWFGAALALWRSLGDEAGLAGATEGLGWVARHTGDLAGASRAHEEALRLRRRAVNPRDEASSLTSLALTASALGDYERSRSLCEEALDRWRSLRDPRGTAVALVNLGELLAHLCETDRADAVLREAIVIGTELSDDVVRSAALDGLAETMRVTGRLDEAAECCRSSLLLIRRLGIREHVAVVVEHLGILAGEAGLAEDAARILGAAEALRSALGASLDLPRRAVHDAAVVRLRSALGDPVFTHAWHEGELLPPDQAVEEALRVSEARRLPARRPGLRATPSG